MWTRLAVVRHAARIAAELGADIMKVNYTGSPKTFTSVVAGCPIPVVIAGGEKLTDERQVFRMIREALDVGAAGVAVGRNVFGHDSPVAMMRAICALVHENASIQDAVRRLHG